MDRISALRNVEESLARFEAGECSLAELERDVRGVLRTYATDFDGELRAFEASGEALGTLTVLASSRDEARERVADLVEDPGRFAVESVE
ncbi:hypothetical protein SAMN05216559_0282 [Halomicrobium zhouii]|uniref:Uncharacterized protein n=1 Tax=Halomicrobium zhouii TaxID=767519 RepID=A0A1I6K7R8_9EURY|nr:hypothetical protein [Halomicrobium zhouii]SFR86920.1 hypothetical protein SAMN05216559_0282 [Halomicrobium zhouii]